MKNFASCFFVVSIAGFMACGNLAASTITLTGLPNGDTDTLSIQLNPLDGAVDGLAGATVGWGFSVDWTSTAGDWISFTGSSLGSIDQVETNPDLVQAYLDFIGLQGGPFDFGLAPASSPWTEDFDGVSQGVGAYQITSDPAIAAAGAEDTGEIVFAFQVYAGDPTDSAQIGDNSYSYYGPSTEFSVTVDAPSTPEPGTLELFLAGIGLLAVAYWLRAYTGFKIARNVAQTDLAAGESGAITGIVSSPTDSMNSGQATLSGVAANKLA
jgi:hypothetical protein